MEILTGLSTEEAHIGRFDKDMCGMLIRRIREFLEVNPYRKSNSGIGTAPRERFVYVYRPCEVHEESLHRVYLEGRETFCKSCLETKQGPVWRAFLLFTRGVS